MKKNNNAAAHSLRSEREAQKVEVLIEDVDRVAIRYSTWTEGLGWCSQKTLRVDAEQLEDLHRAITVARHRINSKRAEEGLVSETARVIQLPTLT